MFVLRLSLLFFVSLYFQSALAQISTYKNTAFKELESNALKVKKEKASDAQLDSVAQAEGMLKLQTQDLDYNLRAWKWHFGVKTKPFRSLSQWDYSYESSADLSSVEKISLPVLELGTQKQWSDQWKFSWIVQGAYRSQATIVSYTTGLVEPTARINVSTLGLLPTFYFRPKPSLRAEIMFGPEAKVHFMNLISPRATARAFQQQSFAAVNLGARFGLTENLFAVGKVHRDIWTQQKEQISTSTEGVEAGIELLW